MSEILHHRCFLRRFFRARQGDSPTVHFILSGAASRRVQKSAQQVVILGHGQTELAGIRVNPFRSGYELLSRASVASLASRPGRSFHSPSQVLPPLFALYGESLMK